MNTNEDTIGRKDITSLSDDDLKKLMSRLAREKATRAQRMRELAPSSDKPQTELQRLAREHWRLVQHSVRLSNEVCDKKILRGPRKGETIPCGLPEDVKAEQRLMSEQIAKRAEKLEKPIIAQLEQLEIYRTFLRDVFGCGAVVTAYLLSEIDIRKQGLKPSSVRRYCGYAVINGKAERPRKDNQVWVPAAQARSRKPFPLKELDSRGVNGSEEVLVKMPLGYNAQLKTRLWQMFDSMRKNAGKCTDDAPYGVTSKYLDAWYNGKHAAITVQGLPAGKADQKGMRKAIDLFLLDLYTLWRSIEGLDIWPSYYDSRRGCEHGGIPLVDQGPRRYTTDAALQFIGNFKTVPLQEKRAWTMTPAKDEEDNESAQVSGRCQ